MSPMAHMGAISYVPLNHYSIVFNLCLLIVASMTI